LSGFAPKRLKRDKTLIASVNRQTASERMKQIIAEKRARGEPLPHNPNLPEARRLSAATRAAKVAERDAKIEPVIRKIMAAGEVSYNRVAATLSAANIPAPKGGRWSADSARRVMGRLNIPSPFRPGRPSPNRHIKLAEAKALDSAGISKAEIAKRLGISITTVYQYLRPTDHPPAAAKQSHSIHRRVKRSLATQEKMRVLALREEGHSAAQIARLMGISRDKVYRILREAGSPTGLTFAKSKQAEIRESHRGGANVGEISEKTGFSRRAIYRMLAGKANSEQPDQEDNNNTITVVDALSLAVWEGQMLQTIWELQAIGFYTHSAIAAELNQRGILNQRILSGQKAGIDGTWNASTVRYFLHKHGNDGPPPELLQKTLASFDAGILPAIRQLRDEGYTTPAELAPQLNKRGLKTLASRYWGVGTVEQLLQRTGLSDVPAIPMQSNSSAAPTVSEPSDTEQRTPDPSRMRGLQPHSLSHTALNLRIARWVDERCLRSADGKTRADDLYRDFCTWAEACGEAFPSTITFNRFLGVIAQTRSGPDRNNCRWFYGLVLRPSDDDPLAARKQHRFAQEMLPLIKKLQPICFYSNAQVARKLNARKKYTLNGRHWTKTDVEQILESENTPAKRAKSLRSSAVVMGTQSPI
jgi:DNA-binding CsgD family transcriptional regulator